MRALRLEGVCLRQGGASLLRGLDLAFAPGEVHAIIGPNGTGKTSLLRAILGELPLAAGTVRHAGRRLGGCPAAVWRGAFGYMPQDTALDVALTVLEVVVLGRLRRLALRMDDESIRLALGTLERIGLSHLADRDIRTLSGGQRQLVLFAQAVMRQPQVLLLDEPVSALDLRYQRILLDSLHRQTRERGWITIAVLHDLNLAAQYADRLTLLGQQGVQAHGAPEDVLRPELIGRVYGVPVEILRDSQGHAIVQTLRPHPDARAADALAPSS